MSALAGGGLGRAPQLRDRPRGRRSTSFLRGFTCRNPLVLAAAVALLLMAALGFEAVFVSGAWTVVPLKYCLRKASDDFTAVSWRVGRVRRDPPSMPGVYVLGGSTARESIVSGDSLARRVRSAGGPAVAAFDLGSINQNFAQSLAVVDTVPDTPAILLVGINQGRFTPSRGDNQKQAVGRELLLKSDFLKRYVAGESGKYRYDPTILPGVFAYLTSWLQTHSGTLLSGELPSREFGQHRYNRRTDHTVAQKEAMVRKWNKRRASVFRRNFDYNLAMLEQLLERARERGVQVVLLELPFNREIIGDDYDWVKAKYKPAVRELADDYGVRYVDFAEQVPLTNGQFHDLSHLNELGRPVWERRLALELAALFADGALTADHG